LIIIFAHGVGFEPTVELPRQINSLLLSASKRPMNFAHLIGFEPMTFCLTGNYSDLLSYRCLYILLPVKDSNFPPTARCRYSTPELTENFRLVLNFYVPTVHYCIYSVIQNKGFTVYFVDPEGFEPPTLSLRGICTDRLCYGSK
jgi:hypothetical protein